MMSSYHQPGATRTRRVGCGRCRGRATMADGSKFTFLPDAPGNGRQAAEWLGAPTSVRIRSYDGSRERTTVLYPEPEVCHAASCPGGRRQARREVGTCIVVSGNWRFTPRTFKRGDGRRRRGNDVPTRQWASRQPASIPSILASPSSCRSSGPGSRPAARRERLSWTSQSGWLRTRRPRSSRQTPNGAASAAEAAPAALCRYGGDCPGTDRGSSGATQWRQ